MAGGYGRSLEETPTWAVAVVCFVLVTISIFIEYILHLIGKWLKSKHKRALFESLEKVKAELMLLGFISLLLTVSQDRISSICIPAKVGNTWHPCSKKKEEEKYGGATKTLGKCEAEGKVPFISVGGLHQLHIFIFALAVSHVVYCILTMVLGKLKMRRWKRWEKETRTTEYQFSHDPERFRFARETSFGRRHLNFWSKTPILLWIVCFFRQFVRSVPKVDYLTLRHGFVMAHLAPHSHSKFDFQKYIKRSLEEDYTVVVGISPPIWFFAVLFLLFNTHGWYSYLWLPFIPLIIILLVGAKLQVIITKMGLRIQDRGDVVKGVPVVQPGDDLFWFNRPRLLLYLINFVLFQNAFQLAFFVWSWYEFGLQSCFHEEVEDIIIRVSMGVLIQILCSYVTFPLYALVTQMGSSMKPTIFNERVATALKTWHHTAKKHVKENRRSNLGTPESSRPGTPTRGLSPVHLLRNYRSEIPDSPSTPHRSGYDMDLWEADHGSPSTRSPSPRHVHHGEGSSSSHPQQIVELGSYVEHNAEAPEPSSLQIVPSSQPSRVQHEINISVHKDFSFDGRPKT